MSKNLERNILKILTISSLNYFRVWKQIMTICFLNCPPFLFIFDLFKHNFFIKTVGFGAIWTRFIGVEGKHDNHSTTTTAVDNMFDPKAPV